MLSKAVPPLWHYPLAVVLPFMEAIPVVPVVVFLRQWLGEAAEILETMLADDDKG